MITRTSTTLTVSWTHVDDGTGGPAWYRVKYGSPIVTWKEATIGCPRTIRGGEIGAPLSCTLEGLEPATLYDARRMSYRVENGMWADARYSNLVTGGTTP